MIFVAPAAAALVGFVSAAAQDASVPQTGLASWYGSEFKGRPTASGEAYNPTYLTAAHRSLPFGSLVHVQNLDNQRDMVVRINDRGPFVRGRILDLSQAAAEVLGFRDRGVARVRITPVKAPSPSPPAAAKAPANATPTSPTAVPASVPAAAGQAHEDGAAAPPDTMATPADPAAFGLAKPDFSVESLPTKSAPATTAQNTQPGGAAGAPQPAAGAASATAPTLANATSPAPATTTPTATKSAAPTTAAAPQSAAPKPAAPNSAAPKAAAVAAPSGDAPASTKSAKTGGATDFYVQIGAYKDAVGAKERAASAAHLGAQLRTEYTGGLYRVLAGPFARRDQANQVQASFARSGIECFVRTYAAEDFESPPVGSR